MAGCAPGLAPAGSGRPDPVRDPDAALFSSVVQGLVRHTGGRIRVEPRPLRSDPSIGPFVSTEHFADVDSADIEARAAVLDRLGVERFRRAPGDRCGSGPGGTPPVVAPGDSTTLRDWLSQPELPTCVLVGLPRPGGVYYPPGGIDRRTGGPSDRWTVRAVTIGRGQATDVLDVVVRLDAGRRWAVVEIARLDALRS